MLLVESQLLILHVMLLFKSDIALKEGVINLRELKEGFLRFL